MKKLIELSSKNAESPEKLLRALLMTQISKDDYSDPLDFEVFCICVIGFSSI
jgi:hypothetical protein